MKDGNTNEIVELQIHKVKPRGSTPTIAYDKHYKWLPRKKTTKAVAPKRTQTYQTGT